MGNCYYTRLEARNIGSLWDGKSFASLIPEKKEEFKNYVSADDKTGMWGWRKNHWGCDGRLISSEVKKDTVQMLTVWTTPWFVVSKLSSLLGKTKLIQKYQDQDNIGSPIFTVYWKNGKMIKAFIQQFDWDTDKYLEREPIDITEKFNCYS